MRFMMLMIPRPYQPDTPAGERAGEDFTPPADGIAKMMKFNEELAAAGALVALDGLHPPLAGARVSFRDGRCVVSDGPFMETKEVLGGYWVIQVASKEEAVEWAKRCPASDGDVIEIRQIFDTEAFPPEVRELIAGHQCGVSGAGPH